MIKAVFMLAAIVLFSGCAGDKQAANSPKPVIKSIAVLPVNDPTWFSLENRNAVRMLVPIAGLAFKMDSREKAKFFTDKIIEQKTPLGKDLTALLVDGLTRQGYQVTVLDGVKGPADDPENFEYKGVKTDADAVLHVYFSDVGVYASELSNSYLPKVNIYGALFDPKTGQTLYDEDLCYGVDAREGKSWAVMADPKFSYASFDALISNSAEVGKGFDFGSQELGKRMLEHISSSLH